MSGCLWLMCLWGPQCVWCGGLLPTPQPCWSCPLPSAVSEQTYCDRLVQDTPFLLGRGRLSEQQVDRIILQLNRYYPQILSNKDAQKVVVGAGTSHSTPPGLGEDRRWKPGSRGCLGPRASALPASMSPVMGTCGWPSRDARGTAGHGAANAPSGPGASQALPHCRRVCTLPPCNPREAGASVTDRRCCILSSWLYRVGKRDDYPWPGFLYDLALGPTRSHSPTLPDWTCGPL